MHDVTLTRKDLPKLRRLALMHQGLHRGEAFGRGRNGAARAIEHLGYVQIDTISVVERAHHHVLRSRVPNYEPVMLDQLLKRRQVYEYWSHAAAFLPMTSFRYSLPYKAGVRAGTRHWQRRQDKQLHKDILTRIASEGPLRSRDLEDKTHAAGGWWNWKPAKLALEHLFMQGDLMVTERDAFQKTYDLTERVLPAEVDTRMPSFTEFAQWLLDQQLRCHGFVSLKGLTYLRRDPDLRRAMRAVVDAQIADQQLMQLRVADQGIYFCRPDLLDQTARVSRTLRILSPFDNVVIQRERLQALFNFEYQIECYVPGPKRKYGYFCLPLLLGDEFIGRLDAKAHREQRHLTVHKIFLEAGRQHQSLDELSPLLAEALHNFAAWNDCDQVSVSATYPNKLRGPLNKALQTR